MQVFPQRFRTLGATMLETYRHLGVAGFYTGFHASSMQVGFKVAINFFVFENAKQALEPWLGNSSLTSLAAGMVSGALDAIVCTTPTERIKVLQIQASTSLQSIHTIPSPPTQSFYNSAVRQIELYGVSTLWSGLGPTLLKQISVIGFRFGAFGIFKDALSQGREQPWHSLVAGGMVGGMSTIFSQPIDTIKSRIQAVHGTTVHATIRTIISRNGWGGFMHGIIPRFTSTSLSMGIIFILYDTLKSPIDEALTFSSSGVAWLLSPSPAYCESVHLER